MNKKGLSDLVATVSIISVSILAISVLSYYIIDSSKSLQLSPEVSCLDLQLNNALVIENVCFNTEKNETQVKIKRSIKSSEIRSIEFVISSDADTSTDIERWKAGEECKNCKLPYEGESKIYSLDSSNSKDKTLYILVDSCGLDKRLITVC